MADYVLVEKVDDGPAAEFWLAVPPARLALDADRVRLKILDASDEAAVRRMLRELRIFARVECPQLVRLLDAGRTGQRLFYATEHLPLGSLAGPARPLSTAEVIHAVADAARAAHALHEAGLAHRDIRPANVLLRDGGACLADLGLAWTLEPDMSATQVANPNAVEFVDPRVLQGATPSRASDIWSLGLTLQVSLSGESAYPRAGADPLSAVRAILSNPPRISDHLPPVLAAVVRWCTSSDPAERPATASELAAALDRHAATITS